MGNPYQAQFKDDNQRQRIDGTITFTDANNQPGAVFNGGTITTGLTVTPTDPTDIPLVLNSAAHSSDADYVLRAFDTDGESLAYIDTSGGFRFNCIDPASGGRFDVTVSGTAVLSAGFAGSANALGFFGHALANRPTITGAKGGNAALTSLLAGLAGLGLIVDNTT